MNLSKGAKITVGVILFAVLLLVSYDIFAAAYWGTDAGATESWVVFSLSKEYPAIPFAFGLLCGHLFLGMKGT